MQGRILGFDEAAGTGMISGEDGKRYRFARDDWRGTGVARAGVAVDFDGNADAASDIYPVVAARGAGAAAAAAGASDAGAKAKTLFTESLATPLALIVLLACALPAISTPVTSVSLFGLDSSTSGSLGAAAAIFGNSSLSTLSNLLILRFIAPLAAVVLIVLAWLEKPLAVPMIVAGAATILAALLIFAYKSAIVSTFGGIADGIAGPGGFDLPRARSMMGAMNPGSFISIGLGVWLLALTGVGLVVAGLGKIHNPLRTKEAPSTDGA
jgi:hypothetical protein